MDHPESDLFNAYLESKNTSHQIPASCHSPHVSFCLMVSLMRPLEVIAWINRAVLQFQIWSLPDFCLLLLCFSVRSYQAPSADHSNQAEWQTAFFHFLPTLVIVPPAGQTFLGCVSKSPELICSLHECMLNILSLGLSVAERFTDFSEMVSTLSSPALVFEFSNGSWV